MSNCTLMEFDRGLTVIIDNNKYAFGMLLVRFLRSGASADADLLKKHYGVTVVSEEGRPGK